MNSLMLRPTSTALSCSRVPTCCWAWSTKVWCETQMITPSGIKVTSRKARTIFLVKDMDIGRSFSERRRCKSIEFQLFMESITNYDIFKSARRLGHAIWSIEPTG